MLISPPFLPDRGSLSEEAWLDLAMAPPASRLAETDAPEGSFPLSLGLAWHNGLHLQAPHVGGAFLPVRAVADGRVVFVHPPTPPNSDIDHPLNHNPFSSAVPAPAWTSDGFIVLRHATDIGAEGATPTRVVYFSVYMHLSGIALDPRRGVPWAVGDAVHRKDALGAPGRIYGHDGQIHFEICCDEAHLRRLLGPQRATGWSEPDAVPTAHGRTDSVFGSLYVRLPADTPISTTPPASHRRAPPGAVAGPRLGTAQWVEIRYHEGAAILASYQASDSAAGPGSDVVSRQGPGGCGRPIGLPRTDPGFEYDLYAEAVRRHASVVAAVPPGTSSPSGWYELLRFGRNLGTDPLPEDAAHWRLIPTAGGSVWADLNAPGTWKFSDADFPAFKGWQCFDDDENPGDQRCDSMQLKRLIRDPDAPESIRDRQALARRLGHPGVMAQLRRAICRFPSEWERETIVQRHGWLRPGDSAAGNGDIAAASARKWERFMRHAEALIFAGLPAEFLQACWRFHPREFVGHLRKCVWLSAQEFAQCIPRKSLSGNVDWTTALTRANMHAHAYNLYIRKYCGDSKVRYAHNLAQSFIETGLLRTIAEDGKGKGMAYGAMYGRGYHQLTWAENYKRYGEFKCIPDMSGSYEDARISKNSMHPLDAGGKLMSWYPRYDPEIVSTMPHIGESSGFYWVSKRFRKTYNMNRVCDLGLDGHTIGFNSWLVNGGGAGYKNRQQFGKCLENVLMDAPPLSGIEQFIYPVLSGELTKQFPPPRKVEWYQSEIVDHAEQMP